MEDFLLEVICTHELLYSSHFVVKKITKIIEYFFSVIYLFI